MGDPHRCIQRLGERFPFYNEARSGNWYDFGFLLGAGSPFLGLFGRRGGDRE
ncbi:MAG: hypothetical protein M0R74_06840 [Dehalococcoidia bacterium]|nr:hypothetical protein [Dehalococcoidia bacterium]